MKKTYNITVYTKKDIRGSYETSTYRYNTLKAGRYGWKQLSDNLMKSIESNEIVNYQLRADFEAVAPVL